MGGAYVTELTKNKQQISLCRSSLSQKDWKESKNVKKYYEALHSEERH